MLRPTCVLLVSLLLLAPALPARDKSAEPKASDAKPANLVDEGSFAVFQNGQRVATEDFTIRQYPAASVTTSHLRLGAEAQPKGATPDDSAGAQHSSGTLEQSSELTLMPDGTLSHYEWKQLSPATRSATVEPSDEVLLLHTVTDGKKTDHSFFLTPATFILDDYVFSTREVLLWRYLASSCQTRASGDGCDLIRARYPILVPRRGTSGEVFVEFKGYDNTPLNGHPQHLRHFLMQSDGPDWHLWLDEKHRLLRISIPDANTEVLRQEK
jgi:hypothetical protein